MKIKYFKNYENRYDCYVGTKPNGESDYFNIVAISKEHFFLMANDENSNYRDGRFDGLYRTMKVEGTDFENLKEVARDKDRVKGLTLINKFHESNPDRNPNSASIEGDLESFDIEKTFKMCKNAKPILE